MKLELKHLAPYLTYGLKCKSTTILFGEEDNGIYEMSLISMRGVLKGTGKPILRPLSDLTKEIEVNGNLFIPNHHPLFKIFINADMDWFMDNCPFFVDYVQVQKLLEWHFDIFGLIDKELAIDINTLED
tara:strand:+ start:427 stop:813 length:387 start_codon:yes stop_codon:yes gene_type:complete